MMLERDLFRPVTDPARQRGLFRRNVRFVEVEIFSYCNRVCTWCTNAIVSRRGANRLMDPALYSRIMDDLAAIGYDGVVWYSRYNEPTAERELFLARIVEARSKLPRARLQTYSNGDYLNAPYILALRDAGLNELRIMAYADEQTDAAMGAVMRRRIADLGLLARYMDENVALIDVSGIDVSYQYQFLCDMGTDRGGTLPTGGIVNRQSPCTIPATSLYIDYDGSVVPCCDIRGDVPQHAGYVVGKLGADTGIFDVWCGERLAAWRREVMRWGDKQKPCDSCSRGQFAQTAESVRIFETAQRMAAACVS